jgi:putative ABC transport system permease protein
VRGLGGLARRSLAGRRLRTALTVLGIGLGVAVLVAALTIEAALDGVADRGARDTMGSAAVRVSALREAGLSAATLAAVRAVPGVSVVGPVLERRTYPLPTGDAAALPVSVTVLGLDAAADAALHARPVASGSWLPADGDVAVVTEGLARADGLAVGATLTLMGSAEAGPRLFQVVGILAAGTPTPDAADRCVLVPIAAAQAMSGATGMTRLELGLSPGVAAGDVEAGIEVAITADPYTLSTPAELAAGLRAATRDIRAAIALIAAIGLFGGAFLIFNTLAMTVSERTRELGLLRAAGMTRRQVTAMVLLVALQLGLAGVVLGLASGVGIAALVVSVLAPGGAVLGGAASEAALTLGDLAIRPADLALSALLGLAVTVAAAAEPAFRAGRIPPVEALTSRLDQRAVLRARVRWLVVVFALVGVGGAVLWPGAASSPGGLVVPLAVFGLLLIVALATPLVVGPLGALVGVVARLPLPVESRLTRGSLVRDRSRTGLTVGALAVGLAVFVALGGVAASARTAATAWMAEVLPGDLVLTSVRPVALDEPAALDLAATAGVERFSPFARFSIASDGRRLDAAAVVGADLAADGRLVLVAGDRATALADLDAGGTVILPQATADQLGLPVGGTLRVLAGRSVVPLRVVGIAARTIPGEAGVSVLVGWREALGRLGVAGADGFVVRFAAGTTPAERASLEARARQAALEPTPVETLAGAAGAAVDRLYLLFAALALVALLVAALGIVNTLTMNVLERVREIAILRATGLTRGQVWRMVMLEAGVLGLVGSVIGVLTGLGAGALLVALGGVSGAGGAAASAGPTGFPGGGAAAGGLAGFTIAWGSVAVALAFGVVLALLAAAYPARIASRIEYIHAVGHE